MRYVSIVERKVRANPRMGGRALVMQAHSALRYEIESKKPWKAGIGRASSFFHLMCALILSTTCGEMFFPMSMDQYRRLFRNVQAFLGLQELDIGPHSFRATFVVDSIVAGRDRKQIREEGRWI